MFNSRAKGKEAEREVAALLAAWWGQLEPGCKFKPTCYMVVGEEHPISESSEDDFSDRSVLCFGGEVDKLLALDRFEEQERLRQPCGVVRAFQKDHGARASLVLGASHWEDPQRFMCASPM